MLRRGYVESVLSHKSNLQRVWLEYLNAKLKLYTLEIMLESPHSWNPK
ncbi:hypothetical protein VCR17J2_10001 [Vibrio coralliirubri]|nr:hypothetical protein VCR17J2_10001 [Vibrio coralliirubri]